MMIIVGVVLVALATLFLFKDKVKEVIGDGYDLNKEIDKINAKYNAKVANKSLTEAEKMQLEKERNNAIAEARKIATERQKYLKLFGSEAPAYYSLLQLTNANSKREQEDIDKAKIEYTKQVGTTPAYSFSTAGQVYNAIEVYKAITAKETANKTLSNAWATRKKQLDVIVAKFFAGKKKYAVRDMVNLDTRDFVYTIKSVELNHYNRGYKNAQSITKKEIKAIDTIWYERGFRAAALTVLRKYNTVNASKWSLSQISSTGEFKPANFQVLFSGKRR